MYTVMKMRITTFPFIGLSRALPLLILTLASCSSGRVYYGARANIDLPLRALQVTADTAGTSGERKPLPLIGMKDRNGTFTTSVRTETDTDGNTRLSVQLPEVIVTAKMKNVPERFGQVDVDFIVSVPEELVHSKWQLNLTPRLLRDGQVSDLDGLVINGADFRKLRDKQYARYEKYLSKIVPDSLFDRYFLRTKAYHRYMDKHNKSERRRVSKDSMDHVGYLKYMTKLERRRVFFNEKMCRNRNRFKKRMSFPGIKERYEYSGRDTARIAANDQIKDLLPMFHLFREFSPEHIRKKYRDRKYARGFENDYDPVTASDSIFLKKMFLKNKKVAGNQRLRDDRHIAFATMVTYPRDESAELDTVIRSKGKFEYYYRWQVAAGVKDRVRVYLDGYVMATDGNSWLLPRSDTLEYAAWPMIQLTDTAPGHRRRIVEREAVSALRAEITFRAGKYDMDTEPGNNRPQLGKVREILDKLTGTGEFVLDSITLSAGCSPEGGFSSNMLLSKRRGESIGKYLAGELSGMENIGDILKFYPKGEDWQGLSKRVTDWPDSRNKQAILDIIASGTGPDRKEMEIRAKFPAEYKIIREKLYPRLRAVELTFHVHRGDMMKDTIHTPEPDTVYACGFYGCAGEGERQQPPVPVESSAPEITAEVRDGLIKSGTAAIFTGGSAPGLLLTKGSPGDDHASSRGNIKSALSAGSRTRSPRGKPLYGGLAGHIYDIHAPVCRSGYTQSLHDWIFYTQTA